MTSDLSIAATSMVGMNYEEALHLFEREFMLASLEAAKGNQSALAENLGIHRNTVMRIFRRCGIGRDVMRSVRGQAGTEHRKSYRFTRGITHAA